MTEARSKRRVLPLFFIVKSFKKPLLICTKLPLNWRKPEIIITIIKTENLNQTQIVEKFYE